MGAFTAEAAQALAGPGWLAERRLAAAERFAAGSLPTPAEEAWRYSRIDQFDLDRYRPAPLDQGPETLVGDTGRWAGSVVCQNGFVVRAVLDEALASKGVVLADLALHPEAQQWLGTCSDASRDPFVDLHDAFLAGGAFIRVPDGVVVDRPFLIKHESRGNGLASFPHTLVVTGADAEVSVLERFDSFDDDEEHLTVPVTELVVGDASRVSYLGLQDQGQHVWQIALQRAQVGQDATLRTSAVALGGDYARLRTEALLAGAGGSSEMVAVYFANESQMLDFRTLQDHSAHHTTSDLLFKGAVEDEARSVYSGLVHLRESAQRARAAQTNRNLVLSEGAAAWSIPNLEIEANDVKCSHASAVGPIDLDQLYYLESHGVPPDVAERLIVFGFFEDVITRLPLSDLAGPLRSAVARKFEARRCCHPDEGRGRRLPEVKVCSVGDVEPDSSLRVDTGGYRLAVVRIGDDSWYVLGDRCSHAEASLSGGEVWPEAREIECPQHGSAFSLESGEPLTLPATQPVPVYEVRVDGDDVLVKLP